MAEWLVWVNDPEAWIALVTLILLEIVLGIDNIVFISILSDRLPPAQRPIPLAFLPVPPPAMRITGLATSTSACSSGCRWRAFSAASSAYSCCRALS